MYDIFDIDIINVTQSIPGSMSISIVEIDINVMQLLMFDIDVNTIILFTISRYRHHSWFWIWKNKKTEKSQNPSFKICFLEIQTFNSIQIAVTRINSM